MVEAEKYLLQSLKITKEIGFIRDIINLLYEFARLRVAQDNSEGAVELLALVIQHPASHQIRMHEGRIRDSARQLLADIEDKLPTATYNAAVELGEQLNLDEVVEHLIGSQR